MVKAQKFVYAKHFQDEPKLSDFDLQHEELPELSEGDVLVEAIYWSVDPYMRVQMPKLPLNTTMIGEQVAKVIDSKDSKYPVNSFVWGYFGWRDYTIFNNNLDRNRSQDYIEPYIINEMENISLSTRIGVLGMTGISAYYGLIDLCNPKVNDTVVVTAAAGAVGSIVGQIAKMFKCHVIGIAGSNEKCKWIKDELHFDAAINYKSQNVGEMLKRAAPNGIDIFFDNVGGELSSIVMSQMNTFGRVALCGAISTYNSKISKATIDQSLAIAKQLKIEGFIVSRWFNRRNEGVTRLSQWIKCGKIKYRESISNGIEALPSAFIGMLRGENIGKALVKN